MSKTTRGSFDIHIHTNETSRIMHLGETVAWGLLGNNHFTLSKEVYIVKPNLLNEFSDVITEADRLLLEARAAVNKANTIVTTPTKAPRPLRPLEYWINTTDSGGTTFAGWVGVSAYMTYNPNEDTSAYRYYSVEKGEWVSGYTHAGRDTFSQTNAMWSTQKPDEYTLARNGRITYNKALIATLVKRKDPVQFLESDDNCLFALVLNGTRHSLFHITSVGIDSPSAFVNNIHTWTRDAALDGAEQIDDMRLTPISLNDALTLRPHIKDAVAYRPDSDMAMNSVYYTRNFSTGEELKWRYDSRTQAWQPSSPEPSSLLGSLAPIDWAHPSNNGWSIGDSSLTSLKDTYLKSLTPKYLVPDMQYDADGSFAFNEFWVAFFENRGGEWFAYSGSTGTYTKSSYLTERMKSGALLPPDSTDRFVDSIPTPIGYRLFDTTKNKWTQSAKNGIALFATADGYTPMDGNELRPWYGPSLVTE